MTFRIAIFAWLFSAFVVQTAALAQVPPSEAEISRYAALHVAAAVGDVKAIEAQLAAGAAIDTRDNWDRTPYLVAAHRGQLAAARALVKGGADPKAMDRQRYDAITIAAVKNDLAMLRLAIELGGDPKAVTSPYDGTALIAAAHLGHHGVVETLIQAGAPLDHVNNLGWTALTEAVILGDGGARHQACVKALVAAGAKLDLADRQGTTPLGHAKSRGYTAIAAMLEKAGGR